MRKCRITLAHGSWQYAAVCCRVLQSVAECCRVLQSVAVCCRVLQSVAVRYSALSVVRHIRTSQVTNETDMSQTNASRHIQQHYVTRARVRAIRETVTPHTSALAHIYVCHVAYVRIVPQMKETRHKYLRHVTYKGVLSRTHESCYE